MSKDYKKLYEEALERAKEFKSPYCQHAAEVIFPELKESEDERIRKAILKMITDIEGGYPFEKYGIIKKDAIAWLEKQGEKSDYNSYKETVKSISIMVEKYAKSGSDLQDFYNNIKVKCKDAMEYDKTWTEKQGEQKPIDKVESKFKVGDWVVYEGLGTYKVVEIHEGWYSVIDSNDRRWSVMFEKESLCHLWTIQDANEGDVLFSGNPFIFRNLGDKYHPNSPTAYCGINSSDNFILSTGNYWWTSNDVYPASKEQCDLLFQKMHEAGYEWDTEKKELKNIEQKQDWSEEEDNKIAKELIRYLPYCDDISKDTKERWISWLKSLNPQKHYKPSEEQMSVLQTAIKDYGVSYEKSIFESLYNDLKSL